MKRALRNRVLPEFSYAIFFSLYLLIGLTGCGSASPPPPPPDTMPPSTPAGLMVTATSTSQINLSWMASTDNVGVSGYSVERCQSAGCSNFAQIATSTVTTFNDTGLTPGTSYSYRVRATDAAGNLSTFSGTASALTLASSTISVTIAPKRGGLTLSQTLTLTANVVNDVGAAGVTWTKSGGTFTGTTTTSASFSSSTPGPFTITATSNADNTISASATIGVTDLTGVFTQRYDPQRTGQNQLEFALTPGSVSAATFGKLFSCPVDGESYGQPLWVANLVISGGTHNVILVTTEHDSVYAFDADAISCVQYWKKSFLGTGITTVPPADTGETGDIDKEIGITGTPVIDSATNTVYVVAKTKETVGTGCSGASPCYVQRLHALKLTDGTETPGSPVVITASVPGNGDGSVSGSVPFNALRENQRPALLLFSGRVYLAWASHGDQFPYHGWVIAYDAATLQQTAVFNTTPNGGLGGIWQSGTGPAADAGGNIYIITGNGVFDTTTPRTNYGESFIKLSTMAGLIVGDFFTPFNQDQLNPPDLDLGSGGPLVLPDSAGSASKPHLLIGGDKRGFLTVLNRDAMGGFTPGGPDNILQTVNLGTGSGIISGIFSTPAFWQNKIYVVAVGQVLKAFSVSNAVVSAAPIASGVDVFDFPGASPAVSSSGTTNGIVWAVNTANNGTPNPGNAAGPAVLFAYDAVSLSKLFSSPAIPGAGAAGNAVKFVVPTVANGKVYVGTQTDLTVFGLLP